MFLITGGGSGIGRALAKSLAEKQKKVLVIGRHEQSLAETAALSPLISYFKADVSTQEGRQQIAKHLSNENSLEGLVHNAGQIKPISPLADVSEIDWQQIMATNLNAPLFLTQVLLSKLNKGRILSIGSGAAYFAIPSWGAYCVSKAGLAMLTRCWQAENPHLAIASVMPGIVDTDMQKIARSDELMDEENRNFYKNLHREGKLVAPSTVAEFLSWLLLDIDSNLYRSKEWDIYDKDHHSYWLKPPHQVQHWE